MTTNIIPASELVRRRQERERQRRERETFLGSILEDQDQPYSAPALPAERREPTR